MAFRWLKLHSSSSSEQQSHYRIVQRLPPELLLAIFINVPRTTSPDRDTVLYPSLQEPTEESCDPFYSLSLVSRAWCGPSNALLYTYVDVSSLRAAKNLRETLLKSVARQTLANHHDAIKTLKLPLRTNVNAVISLPQEIQDLFADIVGLCPNLISLECVSNWRLDRFWFPIVQSASRTLTRLHICNTSQERQFQIDSLAPFAVLRELTLSGFALGQGYAALHLPLPTLDTLSLSSCLIDNLSLFLSPSALVGLKHLSLHYCVTSAATAGLKIEIPLHLHSRLESLVDNHNQAVELGTLTSLVNVHFLHFSAEKFYYSRGSLPSRLTHLSVSLVNVGGWVATQENVDRMIQAMQGVVRHLTTLSVYVRQKSLWIHLENSSRQQLERIGIQLNVYVVKTFPAIKSQKPAKKSWRTSYFKISPAVKAWDECGLDTLLTPRST